MPNGDSAQSLSDAADDSSVGGSGEVGDPAAQCSGETSESSSQQSTEPDQSSSPETSPGLADLVVTVINDDDGSTVSGIGVQIDGPTSLEEQTESDGTATFSSIPSGPYNITPSNPCFNSSGTNTDVPESATTSATLHVTPTHTALMIQQLTFSGNNPVENDTTGPFTPPEWVAGNAQQSPVSYKRNTPIGLTAVFNVTTPPCMNETVQIKGTATFGSASLEWDGTVTVGPNDTTVSVNLTSNQPLANEVGIFESSDITWQCNPVNRGWIAAGTTRNVLYVTLDNPAGSPNYWTLLDISCRAAAGKSTENDFVTTSFVPYTSHTGDGNGFARKRDGTQLTYYKLGAGTPSSGVFSCGDLLSRADGTGRCGAWARFLVAMHQVHGVTSSAVFGVVPINAVLLIVRNCTFNGSGSQPPPFTHIGNSECVKNNGVPGQGKDNPQFTFGDHALVRHSTGIYDPSYGVGPKPNLKQWEDGGIAGIGQMPLLQFTFGGDPHIIPRTCSKGFILYTAVAGDTLDSIATSFGIASGSALYSHPYNASLQALHPAPGSVAPGDIVVIPRDISTIRILRE
jgi:hypothetical protein